MTALAPCTCVIDEEHDVYELCGACENLAESRECQCCGAPMGYWSGTFCPGCREHEEVAR